MVRHSTSMDTTTDTTPGATPGSGALIALVATLAFVLASCSTSVDSSSTTTTPKGDAVVLQGVDTVEIDPFTDSVAVAQYASFPTKVTEAIAAALGGFEAAGDAMRTIPGDTPGLYGGTGDDATCDMDQLNAYLADAANSAKAAAFAKTLNIEVDSIGETLDEFTTVVLSVDLFVTNHGFRNGEANAFGAVLQAGTAIAVDTHGIPRVKCGCGNPLAPAPVGVTINVNTHITGETWTGWNPADVATAEPTADPVDGFDVIDPETGETHRIPVGGTSSSGDDDCVVDADGHGPDCDPEGTDQTPATDAPATTAAPVPDGDCVVDADGHGPDCDPEAAHDPDDRSWGVTGGAATPDEDFRVMCAPNGQLGEAYGTGPYEVSSSVCTAAVHAGVITRAGGGLVAIRRVDGGPMGGSTANGVTTQPTGNPRGFFAFN